MTRESIPGFDLYAELEVSRLASVEVIEAAYRTLAKIHHPDVAQPHDAERIKRLNLSREWLTDPIRRRRYDAASQLEPKPSKPARAGKAPRASRAAAADPAERSPWTSTAKAFGPKTDEVRQFLADLRALDEARAMAIRDGRAAIDPIAFAVARHVAYLAGQGPREDQWLLAREAASVIARGKLGDSPLTPVVSDVVADIAGAITIRDLIPASDFEALLEPWDRRRDAAPTAPAPTSRAEVAGAGAAPSAQSAIAAGGRVVLGRRGASIVAAPPAVVAIVALIALVTVMLVESRPAPEAAVAGHTDAPTVLPWRPGLAASPFATVPAIASPPEWTGGFTTAPTETTAPEPSTASGPVSTPRVTARPPTPGPTPIPTPVPSAVPTPVPTPVPTALPSPAPSPSPAALCEVVNLIGENTANAQVIWSGASFTGTVSIAGSVPPHYKIGWQSLTVGETVPCTSGISVQEFAP